MPKRIVGFFHGESLVCRIFDLRQGLDPIQRFDVDPVYAVTTGADLSLSPDQSYVALARNTTTTPNIATYSDPATLVNRAVPAASFAGTAACCSASNTHYAFGGVAPFLYVFKKSSGALQTIVTTGLGTVYALDFSPNGEYLAVTHSTSPYVRIYKVSDWSYVDAQTASGANACTAKFFHDSSKLFVASASSPYLSVFAPATGVREYSNTNVAFTGQATINGSARAIRYPDGKTIVYASSATGTILVKFDTLTNTPTAIANSTPALGTIGAIVADPELDEDALYLTHTVGSTSPTRTMSKVKFSTGAVDSVQPQIFRWSVGSASTTSAFYILNTTPHKITGTVRDISNLPVKRKVRAYRRSTGELVAETWSDVTTGDYKLKMYDAGPFDVQFVAADGELLNDLFFSKAEPEPVGG